MTDRPAIESAEHLIERLSHLGRSPGTIRIIEADRAAVRADERAKALWDCYQVVMQWGVAPGIQAVLRSTLAGVIRALPGFPTEEE